MLVRLALARARTEIVAMNDERLFLFVPASLTMVTLLFFPNGGLLDRLIMLLL